MEVLQTNTDPGSPNKDKNYFMSIGSAVGEKKQSVMLLFTASRQITRAT